MNIQRVLRNISICFFLFPLLATAQIPNADFENWTNGNPDNWFTPNVEGLATPVTQSMTSQSGSFSARGEVIPVLQNLLAPFLFAGTDGLGFPVSQNHSALTGYYQFVPQTDDQLFVAVLMFDQVDTFIGTGGADLPAAGTYTPFNVPIEYFLPGTASRCILEIVVNDTAAGAPDLGTYFLIDNLALSGPTAISGTELEAIPDKFSLEQNFPNPFNPTTTIAYTLSQNSAVKLDVYNPLGKHVASLVDAIQTPGRHVVQWKPVDLASGIYLYRLQTENGVITRKMLLSK